MVIGNAGAVDKDGCTTLSAGSKTIGPLRQSYRQSDFAKTRIRLSSRCDQLELSLCDFSLRAYRSGFGCYVQRCHRGACSRENLGVQASSLGTRQVFGVLLNKRRT